MSTCASDRRSFLKLAGLAAAAAAMPHAVEGVQSTPGDMRNRKGKYHLRYAPRLDFLSKELTIPQRLDLFAEHGFDAMEYNGLMNHPLAEVETIRKKLDEVGIEQGIFVANPQGWKNAGTVNPEHRDTFLGQIKQAIDYHKVIGNKWCTVITGNEVVDMRRGIARRNCVEALKRAADLLQPAGLTIVIEPLNYINHPGYFLKTSDEAAEIMAAVGSPHVKILFDIYHQQITEGNLIHNIRTYWDYIGYFQVGDVPGRREPGTGEINWKNVFKAIYDKGYTGLLGMEHGLSVPGKDGLLKCFEEYRRADAWT